MSEIREVLGEYPLTRDFVDFNRLNLQHYLWKEIFGYNIHPRIPYNTGGLKIADVGTGTGIWLLDISSRVHLSTELLGLDTDITQVGPKEWLPDNVSVRQWDAFTQVPADLVGKFDMVNLRLFCFIVQDDPNSLIRNLMRLLKPGGYLQWCEADVESMHIKTSSPDVSADCLKLLWQEAVPKSSRLLPSWVKGLPKAFEDEGLVAVEADWQEGKPHTTLAMHWCNLHLYEMIADRLRPTYPQKALEMENIFRGALMQSRKGAMFAFNRVIVMGQKPDINSR
ncbi:hypothetical protein F5X96DRAFT_256518 [Biscogniauxia mediterranea]|nr:hypothetical protein F5X96DRAFT_256518 [Biscogniauxia mediterranea]